MDISFIFSEIFKRTSFGANVDYIGCFGSVNTLRRSISANVP